ncbi:unnamed protein product [Rotaria sp. Silwood2]|nr:unnamed protein product [Rotaria sp. Silwood2]CAF3110733.1 unnamed protein product [Rotaria sp. Silwood2]CAF3160494.1 unnamed protein product [Rotaria sp. Silwood2]CAF3480928.1 unnamed protein product [Rotaria sp. Silwood2]CAF4163233.1 unnamed protein product [Rotaria sp. Silwood2]
MTRRCAACHAITPSHDVNCCQNCGLQFHKPQFPSSSPNDKIGSFDRTPSKHKPKEHDKSSLAKHSNPSLSNNDNDAKSSIPCKYKSLCGEYLKSLSWNDALFDRRFNRCYCSNCYPNSLSNTLEEAGSLYVIPRGWCRFGLQVDKVRADVDHIWRNWIVTYHGTSSEAAHSIVAHRQFLIPGDKRIDGEKIAILPGHIKEKYHIYTSPTIAYSSVACYCPSSQFQSKITNKVYDARIVIQCRQKPGTFEVQQETIGAGHKRICPFIPNSQVEIFTTVRASIVPYGILIHLAEVS